MEYKKNHKIKLTKFGKKFFAFTIVLIIGISVLCLNNSNRNLKEETIKIKTITDKIILPNVILFGKFIIPPTY